MKFFKCAVLPALSAVITALLFLFLGALFLQKSNDPYSALRLLPVGATLGGAILCGLLSALFSKGRSYENPVFAGLLFAASLLLLSLLPKGESKGLLMTLALLALCPVLSLLTGAFLMNGRKSNAKKMRKKAKKRYGRRV
jgi:hypothetical protein